MLFSGCCAVSPACLRVEPEHHRPRVLRTEPLAHDPCPEPTRGAELRHLLEEVHVAGEEEGQARGEVIDAQAGVDRRLHVRDAVREGECDLLCRRRPRLAHVVAADRDRVPLRDPLAAVREQVRDQSHRRRRRIDVRPARRVFLQQVVLDGPGQLRRLDTLLLPHELIQEQQDRRRGVDRHRRAHAVERDPFEQPTHVVDRVDRDARLADLTLGAGMVTVEPHLRREIERRREPRLPVVEQVAEPRVRLFRRRHAGVLPHRPQPVPVHRGVRAPREREGARLAEVATRLPSLDVLRAVDGPEVDPGIRLAALLVVAHRGPSLAPVPPARQSG